MSALQLKLKVVECIIHTLLNILHILHIPHTRRQFCVAQYKVKSIASKCNHKLNYHNKMASNNEPEQHAIVVSTKESSELTESYFDCGTKATIEELLLRLTDREETEDGLDDTMPFSDLSDPSRSIWIVTTAALPWMTGTAVNPFLRALYFVRRRLYLYKNNSKDAQSKSKDINQAGKVTLVIPWLLDHIDAQKLYGSHITKTGQEGKEQQLKWIRKYAEFQCDMKEEIQHLNILFYNAAYWNAFGSIFPTVDICSLIPNDEADVAILEEPEHLNWMRVPYSDSEFNANENDEISKNDGEVQVQPSSNSDAVECTNGSEDGTGNQSQSGLKEGNQEIDQDTQFSQPRSEKKLNELGWAHKFKFVVGVIHTNYSAYMKQYGIGTTIVAAPAINALSAMVVRAYCHKVIRLSGVIPNYAKWKEVTSNVHGVRSDFLTGPRSSNAAGTKCKGEQKDNDTDKEDEGCAPIYFIGKLLWAKGFDKMLKVQEKYRKAHPGKEYFRIDVYGGGPDVLEITRAFHGRMQTPKTPLDSENASVGSFSEDSEGVDVSASDISQDILTTSRSIRGELMRLTKDADESMTGPYSNAKNYINAGFEVVAPENDDLTSPSEDIVMERRQLVDEKIEVDEGTPSKQIKINPISILSDVSEKSISTGIATTKAVKNLADSALKAGLAMTFTQDELGDSNHGDIQTQPSYRFDPPKTIYELRRTPVPARFLGVKDHAMLREMPYKIFLNPSITEVLCTTTAEALAMGKFAIIPKHASNEFFLQFSNCLAYETLGGCVKNIQWALDNEPSPLSEEESRIFTWDAATDRMIEASIVTKREARERSSSGFDKVDSRMAWIHSQGGKKSSFIKTKFFGQTIDKNGAQKEIL